MRSNPLVFCGLLLVVGCQSQLSSGLERAKMTATTKSTEIVIEFHGAGGVKLSGSLMLPAGGLNKRYPTVLLIAGSGPTDRDGNQPGFKADTLKQIAAGLAGADIASFRFDKRAVRVNAGQWPKKVSDFGPYFSWDNHVDDALAAWEAMKKSTFVDPAHCAILGHSEGGTIALAMAARAKPMTLVLVGTPARPYDEVIHAQLAAKLTGSGAQGQKLLAENDRISAAIKKSGRVPTDVPPDLQALYNPSVGVFFKQSFGAVPKDLARAFPGPILVMNGELDVQVSPKLDASELYEVCRSNKGSELALIPLASHNLKPVTSPRDPGIEGLIVPDAIEAMQKFLIPKIGGSEPMGDVNLR